MYKIAYKHNKRVDIINKEVGHQQISSRLVMVKISVSLLRIKAHFEDI